MYADKPLWLRVHVCRSASLPLLSLFDMYADMYLSPSPLSLALAFSLSFTHSVSLSPFPSPLPLGPSPSPPLALSLSYPSPPSLFHSLSMAYV
jgi:hypothetical protein